MTRSFSDHRSTNKRGVLRQECLFCGKQRKTNSQKNEPLKHCLTIMSNRKIHSNAFQALMNFIDRELIKKKKPMLATAIFSLYNEEFLGLGGTHDDINKYTVQCLMARVKDHVQGIVVERQAKNLEMFCFLL